MWLGEPTDFPYRGPCAGSLEPLHADCSWLLRGMLAETLILEQHDHIRDHSVESWDDVRPLCFVVADGVTLIPLTALAL